MSKPQNFNFAQDDGSDVRKVGTNNRYLPPAHAPQPGLYVRVQQHERNAHRFHSPGSYGRDNLMGHAARIRADLARAGSPVPPPYAPAEREIEVADIVGGSDSDEFAGRCSNHYAEAA